MLEQLKYATSEKREDVVIHYALTFRNAVAVPPSQRNPA